MSIDDDDDDIKEGDELTTRFVKLVLLVSSFGLFSIGGGVVVAVFEGGVIGLVIGVAIGLI